jgi:PBP1b-binding outer membrane lipoprotein LpoB
MKKALILLFLAVTFAFGCTSDKSDSTESNTEESTTENQEKSADELIKSDEEKMDSAKRALGIE